MKKITLFRTDDFWGRGINVKVNLNDALYDLPNNSKIQVETDKFPVSIQAKYLWYSSTKISLSSSDEILKIRVKQIFSNLQLLISSIALFGSFILHQLLSDDLFQYLFWIIGVSFLSYMFFFLTIGCKNYFTFTINEDL